MCWGGGGGGVMSGVGVRVFKLQACVLFEFNMHFLLPEHNVPAITDTYKVFVSRKMMYLEPYIQRGLHDHFSPLHYDVCSRDGDKPDWWVMESDLWDQYEFKVRIRRASTY